MKMCEKFANNKSIIVDTENKNKRSSAYTTLSDETEESVLKKQYIVIKPLENALLLPFCIVLLQ